MRYIKLSDLVNISYLSDVVVYKSVCFHCFDTVGWASGRASGL